MRTMRYALVLAVAGVMAGGCRVGPSLGQKSTLLELGMSREQVREILGAPKTTSVRAVGEDPVEYWIYWRNQGLLAASMDSPYFARGSDRLQVAFRDGHLASWGDQLDMGFIMDSTMGKVGEMQIPTIRTESKQTIEQTIKTANAEEGNNP